jgi:hypothetical protein
LKSKVRIDRDGLPRAKILLRETKTPDFIQAEGCTIDEMAGRGAACVMTLKAHDYIQSSRGFGAGKMIGLPESMEGYLQRLSEDDRAHILATASSGSVYFAAFREAVEALGGIDCINGKRVVELGGGCHVSDLQPSIALHKLGAEVKILDAAYPRTGGMFVKSDILGGLIGLQDNSIDAIMALGVLEKGSWGVDLLSRMYLARVAELGIGDDPEKKERLKRIIKEYRGIVPGTSNDSLFEEMVSRPSEEKIGTVDEILQSSTESEEYLAKVYEQMRLKLAPGGKAVVYTFVDDRGLGERRVEKIGFRVVGTGKQTGTKGALRTLRVEK